jgi:hypothetical protein
MQEAIKIQLIKSCWVIKRVTAVPNAPSEATTTEEDNISRIPKLTSLPETIKLRRGRL